MMDLVTAVSEIGTGSAYETGVKMLKIELRGPCDAIHLRNLKTAFAQTGNKLLRHLELNISEALQAIGLKEASTAPCEVDTKSVLRFLLLAQIEDSPDLAALKGLQNKLLQYAESQGVISDDDFKMITDAVSIRTAELTVAFLKETGKVRDVTTASLIKKPAVSKAA